MKILYHHRTMGRGAEGIHISSIIKAFERQGHDVILLSPPGLGPLHTLGRSPLDKTRSEVTGINRLWKVVSKRAPQIIFELLEVLYNLSAALKIRRILSRENISVIYERNAYFLFAGAFLSSIYDTPLVVEVNEVVGIKRARKLIMRKLAGLIERYTFRRAKAIFTVSSYLRDRIKMIVKGGSKIYVTPNAIDPLIYKDSSGREEIREKYNLNGKIVLGFAGWFDWWDRLDLLIEVQKEISAMGYDNVLTMLVGDGPQVKRLKEQARTLGIQEKVIFTGAVERHKITGYIDAIDIGILAHSNEFGSPVVLFEMMALGKPVIAPSLAPITDVIQHNRNGMIFRPLDKTDLIKKTVYVLSNPDIGIAIGKKARKIALTKYTWDNNAKRILASIEGALEEENDAKNLN